MSAIPVIRHGEAKTLRFPVHGFVGQASGPLLRPGVTPLQLGTEGYWAVYGISATMCIPRGDSGSGLANGTNINIQILDVVKNDYLFNYSQDYALNGAPLEHVAGKWGNVRWLNYPKIYAPGTRLLLMASQFSETTPTVFTPLYVCLHAVLTKQPVEGMVLQSAQSQMSEAAGEPFFYTTKFTFAGQDNNLPTGGNRTVSSPMNGKATFFIDSITARGGDNFVSQDWIHSIDPRQQEFEIMFSAQDSVAQSSFNQPDPVPLALLMGWSGSREFAPPTFFEVNPGAEIVATIDNPSAATGWLDEDIEITFAGSILKR